MSQLRADKGSRLMGSLKRFVVSEDYLVFQEYLETQIKLLHTSIESARTADDVYRLQGQISSLRRLQSMKEDVLQRDR